LAINCNSSPTLYRAGSAGPVFAATAPSTPAAFGMARYGHLRRSGGAAMRLHACTGLDAPVAAADFVVSGPRR